MATQRETSNLVSCAERGKEEKGRWLPVVLPLIELCFSLISVSLAECRA